MRKTMHSILLVFLTISMTACGNTAAPSSSSEELLPKPDTIHTETEELKENRIDLAAEPYEIGDIIFADGSVVKEADLTVVDGDNVPVAVIAGFQEDGTAYGLGVHRSETPLQWASDDSDEYPAFQFVNTYAKNHSLSGDFANDWYMPGIEELCDIYQNRETINNSLQHIHALDDEAAMNGLETNWYWSATQSDSEDDYAWFVHYFNGYAGECPKNFTNVHVLAVRLF